MLNKSLENYWAISLNSWSKLNHSNFSLYSNNLVVCNKLLEGSMEMEKVNIINDADKEISSLKKELKRTDDPEEVSYINQQIDWVMEDAVKQLDRLNG